MNFGELQSSISKRLLDPANTAVALSDVSYAINDAVNYWKFKRFWFNTARATGTMTEEDGTIPLPSDFLVPAFDDGGFEIEYSNMRYPLKKLNQPMYDATWLGNGYGLPQWYSNLSGEYATYPLPDRAYTVRSNYLKNYEALAGASDTNDFTNNADRLIMNWALANLYRDFRQDPVMSEAFFNSAQTEYQNLQVMTKKSNATGGLTIYGSLI